MDEGRKVVHFKNSAHTPPRNHMEIEIETPTTSKRTRRKKKGLTGSLKTLYRAAWKKKKKKKKHDRNYNEKFISYAARRASDDTGRKKFSRRINPILLTMEFFCFYPAKAIQRTRTGLLVDIFSHRNVYIGLVSSLAIIFNFYIFYLNVDGLLHLIHPPENSTIESRPGSYTMVLLDPVFVSQVINSQKPLVSAINLLTFLVYCRRHRKMLRELDVVDNALFQTFHCDPNVECLNLVFIFLTALTFLAPLPLRIYTAIVTREKFGTYWLLDFSYILVPLWSISSLLPLYYFEVVNRAIRFWCKNLQQFIRENYQVSFEPQPLKFYYIKFVEIINAQLAMRKFFGLFMLWSMCWSVFTLALAIYFATQTSDSLIPPDTPAEIRIQTYFAITWSCIQITTAVIYILVIPASGTATNEAMRAILAAVQDIVTEVETEDDKFQIDCFTNKIGTQCEWGVTIAGAFPLERGFIFTLLSVIASYSLLLLEFKGGSNGDSP